MDFKKTYDQFFGDNSKKYAINENGTITYKSLDDLCNKFPQNYIGLLKLIIPIIINYMGPNCESAIINTLQKVKIVETQKGESNSKALESLAIKTNNSKNNMVDNRLINIATGLFGAEPIIENNQGQYQLQGEINFIVVKPLEYTRLHIDTFIHEFLHAIKHQSFEIRSNDGTQYLIQNDGLIHSFSSIKTNENGEINTETMRRVNIGIEEIINYYDTDNVMDSLLSLSSEDVPQQFKPIINNLKPIIGQNKEKNMLESVAKRLMEVDEMRSHIRNAQLYGDYKKCQSFFNQAVGQVGKNSWQELNSNLDEYLDMHYHEVDYMVKNLNDEEKRKEYLQKMVNLGLKIAIGIKEFRDGMDKKGLRNEKNNNNIDI